MVATAAIARADPFRPNHLQKHRMDSVHPYYNFATFTEEASAVIVDTLRIKAWTSRMVVGQSCLIGYCTSAGRAPASGS